MTNAHERPNPFIQRHRERVRAMLAMIDDPDTLDGLTAAVADRMAPMLMSALETRLASRTITGAWLDSDGAAQYLGMTRKALYHSIERQGLPVHQEQDGGKMWFRRGELDEWRLR